MSKLEMLEEEILPAAVLAGAFGEDVEFIKCDTHEGSHGEDQFASIVMFSSMKIKRKNITEKVHLVVKFNQESEIFRKSVLTDIQFQNEVFMYRNFLPFLQIKEIVPKFYYGVSTGGKSPEQDVILLQDLCREDYRVKNEGLDLDYDHIIIALKQLARFHVASYKFKNTHEDNFFDKAENLIEAQWTIDKVKDIYVSLVPVVKKIANVLIDNKENVEVLEIFLEKIKTPISYVDELLSPAGPLPVICHGDFCKNNILFKYNENGIPTDVKFVDFGTVRYASPMTDLTFFLFFNTTSASRRKHLDDFLTEYYDVLKSSCENTQIPYIEVFEQEFHSKAVYGFLYCCLQIPTALSEPTDWEELALLTTQQTEDYYISKCNSQATSLLADILRDLIYFKCKLC